MFILLKHDIKIDVMRKIMNAVDEKIQQVIKANDLANWLNDYPWLTGYLGNPESPIWFIAENPSLLGLKKVGILSQVCTPNTQWNLHKGDKLLRQAITEAKLKTGDISKDEGWNCYITNAIKQPDYVNERNIKKRKASYWQSEAELWQPVLQMQIDNGNPQVLVALGNEVLKMLKFMQRNGLRVPAFERIHHYSYIMFRPEVRSHRGPGDNERIRKFKQSIIAIAEQYCA